jgi:arylsulfatase
MTRTNAPNILLIMSDQHRGDCLDFVTQASGNRLSVQTPHLRRLAGSGVHFTRFYSESPVCVPARAILQTGLLPHRSDIAGNADSLPEDHPTLAGCLAEHGYFTQAIGKMHFRPVRARHGLHRLWLSEEIPDRLENDEYLQFLVNAGYGHVEEPNGNRHELYMLPQVSQLPETHHTTAWTGRKTIEFLREHLQERPGQPFFCWTSFQKPHPPFEPPVPWHRMYTPRMAPAPAKSTEELDWLPSTLRKGGHTQLLEDFPDRSRLATLWSFYYSAISFIDSWIGMIVDELERLGLREDTLVIYTSDHGELLGDHWSAGKDCFYEGAACVPGIFSWPGHIPAGGAREQLAGLADIVATILDASGMGARALGYLPDGMSLLPVLRDDAPTRDLLIGQVGKGARAHLAAITPEWKYMYAAGDSRELLFRYRGEGAELYNALAGPASDEARAIAQDLRHALQERYRGDGATTLLDADSPNGFALSTPRDSLRYSGRQLVDPHWLRQGQYARWIRHLPPDWTPPQASPDAAIDPHLPLRSDRAQYTWAPLD